MSRKQTSTNKYIPQRCILQCLSATETIIAICSEDREFTEYLEKASQRRLNFSP